MPAERRHRFFDYSRSCKICGTVFQASRVDARYCSPKCRQISSRLMRRLSERLPLGTILGKK